MNKKIKVIVIILAILSVISIASFFIIWTIKSNSNLFKENILEDKTPKVEIPNTTIYFVGDIMLTRGVESSVKKNFGNDYNKLFENIPELKDADILLGNLEGDVSDVGKNVGSQYSFRMNPLILSALSNAGFDIVSFANNHVGDWSIDAFSDTLNKLQKNNILKTGAGKNKIEVSNPTIIEKNGTKFGFLAFSDVGPKWLEAKDNSAGILLATDPNFDEIIKNAKTQCDVLIVSFHFGEEYKTIHNKRQELLAHKAIDDGADLIIGHHPHVIQDIEEYNGKTIVYSLGNFIFDQKFSKETMRGMLFEATYNGNKLIKNDYKIMLLDNNYQVQGIFTPSEVREIDDLASNPCLVPGKEYENIWLLNVGQDINLPDVTYIPSNLREIKKEYALSGGFCLVREARDAVEKMIEAAKKDGVDLKVNSAFRSYQKQESLFSNAEKNASNYSSASTAKPGYSEHQLGTAVDITGSTISYMGATDEFYNTKEDFWLRENSYLYGFVQSYPMGKESITGYKYEPWHYRYVGVDITIKVKNSGLTLKEYLDKLNQE